MIESKWICERCERKFDLENGDSWVTLVEEELSPQDGKLTPLEPYERICYKCADKLYAIVEKCNKDCLTCEVIIIWGLSIKDCLNFQLKFNLIDFSHCPSPYKNSLEDTEEILRTLNRL